MSKNQSMRVCLLAALSACALLLCGVAAPALAETLVGGEAEPVIGEAAVEEIEGGSRSASDDYREAPDGSGGAVSAGRAGSGVTESGLEYGVRSDGTAYILSYEGESGEVVVPSSIDGHTVTEIASDAFYGLHITSVTLPDTITKIGNQAFRYTGITQITLPESLKELGWRAFWGCNNLITLNIPAGLEPMQYAVHASVLPSGESYMREYYYNPVVSCDSFTGYTVSPDSANYKAVDGVLFSKDGSVLYSWPFGRNVGGSYTVPQGTKVIADEAFAGVKGLTSITFPNTLEIICEYAFYDTDLVSVSLPDSVTEVQARAFQDCTSLTSVRLSSGMRKVYEVTFVNCTSLASVTNTRSIEEIGWHAFAANGSPLSSFEFGDNVTFIATEAFYGTQVSESSYPSYLTALDNGNYAITEKLIVSAEQNYDYAREVLNLVNQERASEGASALTLDAKLTEAAMQRAAEISLLFEHTRPDGSDCFSVSSKAYGENIAAGSITPDAVMSQWMNSSGHRSNILNSRWGSMGVGCVKVGSITYWVQLFSDEGASGSVPSGTRTQKATIQLVNSVVPFDDASGFNLNMWQEDPEPLKVGDTYELTVGVENPGWTGTYCSTDASGFTWKSSNTGVVTVGADGVVHAVGEGTATVSATSSAGYTWTKNFSVSQSGSTESDPSQSTKMMHRLYNQWTGEHFYTSDAGEKASLVSVGWTDEGVGWIAPASGTPVYRLYNPYVAGGDHHYTMDEAERDALVVAGWRYEGVGWCSAPEKDGVPLYRQYNPYASTGTHNYTTSKTENDHLVSVGWRAEGIAWYGVSQ